MIFKNFKKEQPELLKNVIIKRYFKMGWIKPAFGYFDKIDEELIFIINDSDDTINPEMITEWSYLTEEKNKGEISDGWHTFDELYEYRMLYNAIAFNKMHDEGIIEVEKSWRHNGGEKCFGEDNYFIVVAYLPDGQISNHYHREHWDLFQVPEVEKVTKEFDNHTPKDVTERLYKYLRK